MIPWTVAHQAPLSVGFSRQEHWCGLPFPAPGNFPTQESNPGLPHCRPCHSSHGTIQKHVSPPDSEEVSQHGQVSLKSKRKCKTVLIKSVAFCMKPNKCTQFHSPEILLSETEQRASSKMAAALPGGGTIRLNLSLTLLLI